MATADHAPSRPKSRKPFRLVKVGVRYCVLHDGVANEDDAACDFAENDVFLDHMEEARVCRFRELYRKERR